MSKSSPCHAVRQWGVRNSGCRELLVIYGGMTSADLRYLRDQMAPGSRIYWIEAKCPQVGADLEPLVEEGTMGLAGVDQDAVRVFFDLYDPRDGLQIVLLNAEQSSAEEQNQCYQKLREVQEEMRLQNFATGTLVSKGPHWQRNTLVNLPHILTSPGIGCLDGQFENKPALVVGAGPSLNEALPMLARLQDRFMIISTGTALAPLRKAGIRPDLVIVVDASHLVSKQFNVPCDDLYFVGSTVVCPEVPGRFKGEFYSFLDDNPIDQWVRQVSCADGELRAAGTVTACGMHLAMNMGCSPVVSIGLDLSYAADGHSHAEGTMYDGCRQARHHLVPVPGNWEETVYTTRQFACYIDLIRNYVADFSDCRFVNVSNGGARIEGMELQRVEALAELAAAEPFDARRQIERSHCMSLPDSTWKAQEELLHVVEYLEEIRQLCRTGAMASNRLMLMRRFPERADPAEMRQCIEEVTRVDEVLEAGGSKYDFLKMSLRPAAFRLASESRQDENSDSGERAIGRSRNFYEQVAGAATWTSKLILACCETLRENAA